MKSHDLHSALKTEVISQANDSGLQGAVIKLQAGKEDLWYSVHISPNSYSTAGLQLTDTLAYMGFQRTNCSQFNGSAYCDEVSEGFDLPGFLSAISKAHGSLVSAERFFQDCGFRLPQPEGWGHFTGNFSRDRNQWNRAVGDGHTSPKHEMMKKSEDDKFNFAFTWVDGGSDKGWVTHLGPKHAPLSAEFKAAFKLLGLNEFAQCPEFDFEPCFWSFIPFHDDEWGRAAEYAHRSFDNLSTKFSLGLEQLLLAHSIVLPFGRSILPIPQVEQRQNTTKVIEAKVVRPQASKPDSFPVSFDVAISFAGSNRTEAEELAERIRAAGFSVFYDNFYPEQLWGKNLADLFNEIYSKRARFCVMFVSKEYVSKEWTTLERQSAQARALKEKGDEYILPIQVDGTELPGMPQTVGYLTLEKLGVDKIAELLVAKLRS